MKKLTLYVYNILGIICFIVWIITTIFQVISPHPYRGLIGNTILVIGFILFYIHSKINHKKSFLYDPDKKKHIRNWIIYILILALTVVMVGFLYWKVF